MNRVAIFFIFYVLFAPAFLRAQVTVPPGAAISVQQGTSMVFSQNLIVRPGGTLTTDGNIIMNAGSFADSGTAVFTGNSSLVYNGVTAQQLYIPSALTVGTLVLNNATGLAPNNSITILDSLVLVNGVYSADTSFPIHFANGATNPQESNNSYIMGRAIMDPVAAGTGALNFLGCSMVAGSDMGTVSIVRTTGPDAVAVVAAGDTTIAQSWVIGSSNNAANPSRNITFSWLSAQDNGRDMHAIYPYSNNGTGYTALSNTPRDVSGSDPRNYALASLSNYNRLFTFASHAPVGVPQVIAAATKVTAFPNPFGSVLSLSITKDDEAPVQVRIMDMSGKTLLSNTYKAGRSTMLSLTEVGGLPVGSYLVQVYNDHFGKSLKLVKAD